MPPLRKLKVDLEDLLMALESSQGFGTMPIQHFLDTQTGEILMLHDDFEDADEVAEQIDSAEFGRFARIEPLESHESFRIMEDFVESLEGSRMKERLLDALSRNKPFRRFKDVVHSDLGLRDDWFAFQREALTKYARKWLAGIGIEPEWTR